MNLLHQSVRTLALLFLIAAPLRADVNSDLAFSAFPNPDINSMAGGAVLQARGGLVSFSRGIITQSLYIIDAPVSTVQNKLVHWNPAAHPELKVWFHNLLPAKPTTADFTALASLPDNSSVRYQLKATAASEPENSLQLSKSEAQLITTASAQEKDPKKLYANVWSQILARRAGNFLNGQGGSDTDVVSGGDIQPLSEIKSLLHADPKVYGQYQQLLNQTPLKNLPTTTTGHAAPVDLYYDMFDIQGSASLGTGAIYQAASGASIQSVDVEYYTNYGVYTTVELEQLWPITINGKAETLVWRDDLVSAPNIAYLHGTERLASGMIMLQEVKQAVEAFRSEFK